MDLDASLKSLHTFKQKLEKLFDGGLLDRLETAAAALDGESSTAELAKRIEEIGEHVAALEQRFDELDPRLAAIEKLADPSVLDLLDWLAGRREALDVVLSLGETANDTPEVTDPVPVSGKAGGISGGAASSGGGGGSTLSGGVSGGGTAGTGTSAAGTSSGEQATS